MNPISSNATKKQEAAGRPRLTPPSPNFGWRRLQLAAALATLASFVIPMLIGRKLESFLLAMAAPVVVGLLVMVRWSRVGAIWLGITSLGLLVSSAAFLPQPLTHPESTADFIPLLIFTVSTLAGSIAAIPSFREPTRPASPSRAPRRIAAASAMVILAGALWSLVAARGVTSVAAGVGDVRLVTKDIKFMPAAVDTRIDARGGKISIYVTNRDATRHTFTIDSLGVDLNVPPNSSQRITFSAGPGTYRFYCRPHSPGMSGELIVR